MLRKVLLASSLLIASGSALAWDDSRHGVNITPRVTITFGSGGHYDHRPYVYAPRRVYSEPVYYREHGDRGRDHGWNDRDYRRDDHRYDDIRHDRPRHRN